MESRQAYKAQCELCIGIITVSKRQKEAVLSPSKDPVILILSGGNFAIEVIQTPNTVGNGLCTFRDKDGDTITFRGLAKGTLGGLSDATMDFVHGTGK